MRVREFTFFLRLVSVGAVLSVAVLAVFFVVTDKSAAREFLLYASLPRYPYDFFAFTAEKGAEKEVFADADYEHSAFADEEPASSAALPSYDAPITNALLPETYEDVDLVGTQAVSFYAEPAAAETIVQNPPPDATGDYSAFLDLDKLSDLSLLKSAYYSVEPSTVMVADDFSVRDMLAENFTIDVTRNAVSAPKVLIFHTHMYEDFADSNHDDVRDGVYGVGQLVADTLAEKYGIPVLHYGGRFDMLNGAVTVEGSYDRMEPEILKLLEKYPTIEVAIDIHRDGINENIKLCADINGETAAQIMFVNGLSRIIKNGESQQVASLPNPFLRDNLAFSLQAQIAANELYPNFARKIYLKPYRYSLNMLPKSLLIEVGAQTNTKAEAFRTAEPLADILAKVLLR